MKKIVIILVIIIITITTGCSPQEYEVKIDIAPEDSGEVVGVGTYEQGEKVKLAAISKEEYDFFSWEIDGEIVSEDQILEIAVEENIKITGNFKEIENKKHYINL
ncbi:MAG: hypothetical protein R6U59_07355, partial [Eubacteriales bacterium]